MPESIPPEPAQTEDAGLPDFVRSQIETHSVGRVKQRWAGARHIRLGLLRTRNRAQPLIDATVTQQWPDR